MENNGTAGINEEHGEQLNASSAPQLSRHRLYSACFKFRWFILYVVTFAALIWWYEFRPAILATQNLQGTWRAVEGEMADERLVDWYFHVEGRDTWFFSKFRGSWQAPQSRITLRPAENIFVMHREYGFDYGKTRETEFMVCIKDDKLYFLHGLATYDPTKKRSITKLRRVDALPNEAKNMIHE